MPISDKQLDILAFSRTHYKAIIADGAVRSGKSSTMTVAYIDWAMRDFNNQNFIFLGITISALLRNIIDPYTNMAYAKRRYKMKYLASKGILIVERGNVRNQFILFGADNKRSFEKIQGLTAAGCFVDEVALCERSAVEQALARCSVEGSRFWFNCNPSSPMHWFYLEWILQAKEKSALHIHFKMTDNPSLSDETIKDYETRYTGVFKQRYIDGEWVQAEGLVYPFDKEIYTISAQHVENIIQEQRGIWYVSIDYGISNPFAALLWYVTRDTAYCVDEYYYDGRAKRQLTDAEHYDNVAALIGDRRIEDIIIDPSATSFKVEIDRHDKYTVRNADNDVINGIATTSNYLYNGRVKISEKCKNLLLEMTLYRWDESSPEDRVIKESDHGEDSLRYMCYTVLIEEFE